MPKFRKKPVVIEAFQWTGNERPQDWPKWATKVCLLDGRDMVIDTLEGRMKAALGDWIICGVKGEQYPCKPDIFFATYDPVCNCRPDLVCCTRSDCPRAIAIREESARRYAEAARLIGSQRDGASFPSTVLPSETNKGE